MPTWLAQLLSNPSVVSTVVAAFAFGWHAIVSSGAAHSSTLAHAIAGARSAMSSIVATALPGTDPAQLAAQLADVASKHLGAVGIDTTKLSPLAAAMVNAAVHELVGTFVDTHPDRAALRAAVLSVSSQPAAKAA